MKNARLDSLEVRRFMAVDAIDSVTSIAFSPTGAAIGLYAAGITTRTGSFSLPAIGTNGSADFSGSNENDVITVERVQGISETIVNEFPADGEADWFNFINADGERTIGQYIREDYSHLDEAKIAGYEAAIVEYESYLADYRSRTDRDYSEEIAEQQSGLEHAQQQIAYLQSLPEKFASGDFVKYTLGGVFDYYVELPAELSSSAKININAGSGADKVSIATNVPLKASIFGGSGSDTLTGGKKQTNLYGGGGNDKLVSRSLRGGTLDGGAGSDRYFNRTASEITIKARNDGDSLAVVGSAVKVSKPGIFGTTKVANKAYYLIDDGATDLLA